MIEKNKTFNRMKSKLVVDQIVLSEKVRIKRKMRIRTPKQ